ncbi:MAG: hypothetical protein GX333_03480 [Syntrophomonadaceae bacterium]|nr:hypothetical protein [Syntrophomonadaceae bacterium]
MFKRQLIIAIAGILILAIGALNISNSAINNMTSDDKGAIFFCQVVGQDVCVEILGEGYEYSGEALVTAFVKLQGYMQVAYKKVYNHFYKIWHIGRIIFFA